MFGWHLFILCLLCFVLLTHQTVIFILFLVSSILTRTKQLNYCSLFKHFINSSLTLFMLCCYVCVYIGLILVRAGSISFHVHTFNFPIYLFGWLKLVHIARITNCSSLVLNCSKPINYGCTAPAWDACVFLFCTICLFDTLLFSVLIWFSVLTWFSTLNTIRNTTF